MDTTSALTRFEAALSDQLALSDDPAVETAGRSLAAALRPATRELTFELAGQAAEEVRAQLPEHDVQVVLQDGEPALSVQQSREQPTAATAPPRDEGYEARLTLRLPPSVKQRIEEAAEGTGDSINRWVVEALWGAARQHHRPGRRVQGTVRT